MEGHVSVVENEFYDLLHFERSRPDVVTSNIKIVAEDVAGVPILAALSNWPEVVWTIFGTALRNESLINLWMIICDGT